MMERPASRHGVICAFVALFFGVEVPLVVAAGLLLLLAAWVM